jgi:hypothetical protein
MGLYMLPLKYVIPLLHRITRYRYFINQVNSLGKECRPIVTELYTLISYFIEYLVSNYLRTVKI